MIEIVSFIFSSLGQKLAEIRLWCSILHLPVNIFNGTICDEKNTDSAKIDRKCPLVMRIQI